MCALPANVPKSTAIAPSLSKPVAASAMVWDEEKHAMISGGRMRVLERFSCSMKDGFSLNFLPGGQA